MLIRLQLEKSKRKWQRKVQNPNMIRKLVANGIQENKTLILGKDLIIEIDQRYQIWTTSNTNGNLKHLS